MGGSSCLTEARLVGSGKQVDGKQVEGVDKFTYLGSHLSSAEGSRSDQRRRMGIASSTMQRMSHVWRQSNHYLAT